MIRSAKGRALCACVALAACFTLFSYRLVVLQVCRHERFRIIATGSHVIRQPIYARRGLIQDVNQETLAENVPVATIFADAGPKVMRDPAKVASILAGPLELPENELAAKLESEQRYIVLKKKVPVQIANDVIASLRKSSLRGVYSEPDSARNYPNGSMLSHVIGFLNGAHQGVQGIEMTMDNFLRGDDGYRFVERDRTGKELVMFRGQERAARDGRNVQLTVDLNLQNIVETELDDACSKFHPERAVVILMRPKTGEILALANRPTFDLNDIATKSSEFLQRNANAMINSAVINQVEPGSTFKIVTASAALNEHLVQPSSLIFCENGHFNFAGRILHDHHGFGDISVNDILIKSSNIGAAKLALQLGDQRFYEYIRRFGFGERTGISLPGEISGKVKPPYEWQRIDITRMAMGHSVDVTPLQSITAMAAIANDGHLMMPQIVHQITNDDGSVVQSFPPIEIRAAISEKTAHEVRDALKNVVSDKGTAALAKVAGFLVAGKTGTAEKINPAGGYLAGKYVVSFIGFMPADNPEFVGLVMLDDAKVSSEIDYGGQIAGPIFAHIAEKAARYLNLQPQPEPPSSQVVITQRDR